MKNRVSLFVCVFICSLAFGQAGKLKRADNYYRILAYALASDQYEGLIGSSVDSPKLQENLADCYFQMGKTQEAEKVYSMLASGNKLAGEALYQYAQCLKENGKYQESDAEMRKFIASNPNDIRSKEFATQENYMQKIEAMGIHFTIKHLNVNTAFTDFGGYPTADEKDVFFLSSLSDKSFVNNIWTWKNENFLDLRLGERGNENEILNNHLFTKKVNSRFHEGPLCYGNDGTRVYFTRNNLLKGSKRKDQNDIQNLKLYIADVSNNEWSNIREFVYNSRDYSVGHPSVSPDGKWLYFSSDKPGGFGGADVYKSAIKADGTFGEPINLGNSINTEGQDMFPWMSKEGHLFYSSDGKTGLGGLDVFIAMSDGAEGFKLPLNVGKPVNSQKDDFAFTMLADNQTGYFSSNREGGAGSDDIYSYVLTKPFIQELKLEGIAYEKGTKSILANTEIELLTTSGELVGKLTTNEMGQYAFPIEEKTAYVLKAKKSEYFDEQQGFDSQEIKEGESILIKDSYLEKDPGLALYALITDSKTKTALEGVSVKITDNLTGQVFLETITASTGDALKGIIGKKVSDRLSYNIELKKEGYFPKTVTFNTKITEPGVINVNQVMKDGLAMDPEVKDLRDLIQINDIQFDYNKFNIRPDAAKELDKVIAVMNKYPSLVVELGSHTDCRGSIAYNETLSDKRAKASAAYIKARISKPERIYGKGYGESVLLNGCACEGAVKSTCTDAEHQENRRTEFKVISFDVKGVDIQNNSSNSFGK